MGFNIKSYLQKQVVEGFKKQVIRAIGQVKLRVEGGYTITGEDVDALLLAIRVPAFLGQLAKPFIAGLELRDLVGKYDDIAIRELDRAIGKVKGWRL